MGLSKKLLQRRWIHSHEEDTETTAVYRPASFDFPPSRGRRSFELGLGGRYVESAPGPTDKPLATSGTWEIDRNAIAIRLLKGKVARSLTVESVTSDRLAITKPR